MNIIHLDYHCQKKHSKRPFTHPSQTSGAFFAFFYAIAELHMWLAKLRSIFIIWESFIFVKVTELESKLTVKLKLFLINQWKIKKAQIKLTIQTQTNMELLSK